MLKDYRNKMMTPPENKTAEKSSSDCPACGRDRWQEMMRVGRKVFRCLNCGHVRLK
jgi:uncharacterized Zn finger protein